MTNKLNILILHTDLQEVDQKRIKNITDNNLNYNFIINDYTQNKKYDACIVLNTPEKNLKINVINGNVFCYFGESGERFYHPFMFKKLNQYDKIFSPIKNNINIIQCPLFLGSSILDFKKSDFIKDKILSFPLSNLLTHKGHRLRFSLYEKLKNQHNIPCDFYGRGINPVKDKIDMLKNYKYVIVSENLKKDFYITEKIQDAFMAECVPIYYGADNITDFYPEKSLIKINLENLEETVEKIKDIIKNDNYEIRLQYVKKSKELVLNKYSPNALFKMLEEEILENYKNNKYKCYNLKNVWYNTFSWKCYTFIWHIVKVMKLQNIIKNILNKK